MGIFFVPGTSWRGNDATAQGSLRRPCQSEVQCLMLAAHDEVRSYWTVYR